jgi:hypothetical protein
VPRQRRATLDAALKTREQMPERRKRSALHRRVWRRYLREPFWDLKTCLFAHCTGKRNTPLSTLTLYQLQRLLKETEQLNRYMWPLFATLSIVLRFFKQNVTETEIVGFEVLTAVT